MESVAAFELKDTRLPVSRENPILEEIRQLQREMSRIEVRQTAIETQLVNFAIGPDEDDDQA